MYHIQLHIRDLPRNAKSIPSGYSNKDILWGAVKPDDFENIYVIPEDRRKIVNELKQLADNAPEIYLATDDDREGEAIAYHLKEALELKDEPKRIKFNEITPTAVLNAINNPEKIDIGKFSLVNTAKYQQKEQEVSPGNLSTLNVPEWITRNTLMYSTNVFNKSLFILLIFLLPRNIPLQVHASSYSSLCFFWAVQ